MTLTVGSLFSGIGGIDLGLERVGMHVLWQVENDLYCTQVLAKHWPDVTRYGDIQEVDFERVERVDVLAGGFPCQPVSLAGKGRAQADDRWLWPEFARAIRLVRPRYVLVENVPGLLGRGFGDVLADLAALGFDAEWSIVSACAVGATHTRERLFIVAHSDGINGAPRVWDFAGRWAASVLDIDAFESSCVSWRARLEDPSELYRGADGVSDRMDRNHALGNAVVPQVIEWIGHQIVAFDSAVPS